MSIRTDAESRGPIRAHPRAPERGAGRTSRAVTVTGTGHALPTAVLTNHDLEAFLATSDQWISRRTGIRQRYIAGPEETTTSLAIDAGRRALGAANLDGSQIDLVVVATCTSDTPLPSTASHVAAALHCRGGSFDVDAACAGFAYGLAVAAGSIEIGLARRVLLIGADTMSSVVDGSDRGTAVLFGDGAAALVLEAAPAGRAPATGTRRQGEQLVGVRTPGNEPVARSACGEQAGLVAVDLAGVPEGIGLLAVGRRGPGSSAGDPHSGPYLHMDGRELFRRAVSEVVASIRRTLLAARCTPEDVRWFVPHQANVRLTEAIAARAGLAPGSLLGGAERFGNTSAASIPLSLAVAAEARTLRDGDLLLVSGFGAGFSTATVLWRWEGS